MSDSTSNNKSRNETQCNDGGVMTGVENRHCAALHSGFCVDSRFRGSDGKTELVSGVDSLSRLRLWYCAFFSPNERSNAEGHRFFLNVGNTEVRQTLRQLLRLVKLQYALR